MAVGGGPRGRQRHVGIGRGWAKPKGSGYSITDLSQDFLDCESCQGASGFARGQSPALLASLEADFGQVS
jgi:hypothetical protein